MLAETKDGKRVYNSDKTVRTATMHTVGDSEGYIATGVQTSYKYVITGYNFVDCIYNLKKYGKGNDVNLTINAQQMCIRDRFKSISIVSSYSASSSASNIRGCLSVLPLIDVYKRQVQLSAVASLSFLLLRSSTVCFSILIIFSFKM